MCMCVCVYVFDMQAKEEKYIFSSFVKPNMGLLDSYVIVLAYR